MDGKAFSFGVGAMQQEDLRALIRTIPDFPKPGILFRDVTTLIGDGAGFSAAVSLMAEHVLASGGQVIAGVEARGFIFGAAVAARLSMPFVLVRKPGKLPVPVLALDYALEYGTGTLEIDPEAVPQGARVVVIDDLIATGGTVLAAVQLVEKAGGVVVQAVFAIDLPDLGGAQRLRDAGVPSDALMEFEGH